jgi:hypothetical protein
MYDRLQQTGTVQRITRILLLSVALALLAVAPSFFRAGHSAMARAADTPSSHLSVAPLHQTAGDDQGQDNDDQGQDNDNQGQDADSQ